MTMPYEKVHVYARSHRGTIVPLQFIWRQQRFDVYQILDIQKRTLPQKQGVVFKVTTLPRGTFILEFDFSRNEWYLWLDENGVF